MSKMTKNKLALLALAGLGAVATSPAFAVGGMTVDSKGGIEVFDANNNDFWFKFGGRLAVDQVFYDGDEDNFELSAFPSGGHIREGRLLIKGGVGANWVYKMDINVFDVPGNPGQVAFGEAFVGYTPCKDLWFAIGQVSIPFGLENWANGYDLMFMEMSMPSYAFSPDKGIGLYGEWHGHMFTVAAAVYHPRAGFRATGDVLSNPPIFQGPAPAGSVGLPVAGTGPFDSDPGSDDVGADARVTFSPVHDEWTVYHAAVAARYERFHEHANNFDYWTPMEIQSRQSPFFFTNIPPNSSKDHHVWGFELAGRWGPLLIQGEYMVADVDRDDVFPIGDLRNPGGDLDYYGYYLAASYVLTGETRDYDFESGTFGPVHPVSRKGAWEIAVRHSFVNLLDNQQFVNIAPFPFVDFVPGTAVDSAGFPVGGGIVAGNNIPTTNGQTVDARSIIGSAHATTVGLNWWVNENVKLMANYVRTSIPGDFHVDGLGLRAMVTW